MLRLRRIYRQVSLFVLLALLAGIVPPASAWAQPGQTALASAATNPLVPPPPLPLVTPAPEPPPDSPAAPAPVELTATPVADPQLPSLTLDLTTSADEVTVGDTVVLTVTVANQAPDPAQNLQVTLPVPAGAVAVPGGQQPWTWQLPTLGSGAQATFAATLRLVQLPPGRALLAQPQVTARGLPQAITRAAGALAQDRAHGRASARFTPGAPATLHSDDGHTEVQVPAGLYNRALTLQHSPQPPAGHALPPAAVGHGRGLGAFFLDATDDNGAEVHQFQQPLTIQVDYTPQQLQALDIAETDLTLFWYDESARRWMPLPTDVDSTNYRARATVDHFTPFQLGDGSSPSAAFIPSLQGWQVSLSTGSVSYSYPIEVPAGPAGLKPSVQLSYNSSATDGKAGLRAHQQASWVGKGWSLDTGYIALNKVASDPSNSRYYSLVLNGQSFDLVRGNVLPGAPGRLTHPEDWEWHPTNESFLKARVITNGLSDASRGGYGGGAYLPRYLWQVWTKDGTRYDFTEDAWQGWEGCATGDVYMETYKWYLSTTTDTHNNTLNYSYGRASGSVTSSCLPVGGVVDYDVWPTTITWAGGRYKVEFVSQARPFDTLAERAPAQLGTAPQETRRLTAIKVWSQPGATWQLVRQYNLGYDDSTPLVSDATICDPTCRAEGTAKLTLTSIQRIANDGVTALPATTFNYGRTRGSGHYGAGTWNRLTSANNGQGGIITFAYDTIGTLLESAQNPDADFFANNHRVTTKTMSDGLGHSYTWSYTYQNPAYNSLGSGLGGRAAGTLPNSATVYYNVRGTANPDQAAPLLIHAVQTEFRGHSYVTETDPNGNATEHWFIQGDAGCTPTTYGQSIMTDACFLQLRDQELRKGRESRTISHAGGVGGPKLSEVQHTFAVQFYSYGQDAYADDRVTGLWRAFPYESSTVETAWEGTATGKSKTTNYTYEFTYGNLTQVDERDANNALLRRTTHSYATLDNGSSYIVDRSRSDNVFNGALQQIARTVYAYDGSYGAGTLGTKGELTLVRKFYDVPASLSHSADTSYTYDTYGNQATVKTYQAAGTYDGTTWSAPGSGSASRTTTNTYDATFHAFLTQVDPPLLPGGLVLTEQANYDYRMGTLISVTDSNGNATTAEYDGFGRMVKLIKKGDSSGAPTVKATYYDTQIPFKYLVEKNEVSGSWSANRPIQQFYDGLGRLIQTKSESIDGAQNVVVDKAYDGLGQVVAESQPRYVTETPGTTFWSYDPPGNPLYNATTTTYDALGRATQVKAPDNSATSMWYTIPTDPDAVGPSVTTTDARGHKTRRESDVFGRMWRVREYSGNGGTEGPYTVYATTTYAYSPLDLLTGVTNQSGNATVITYDSLGRKTTMQDPDMGTWHYQYDVNGNLTQQTDANLHTITFGYDALERLTSKSYSTGEPLVTYRYDEAGVPNGKGQRTSMSRGSQSTISWQYDTRGRTSQTKYQVTGLPGSPQVYGWAYDTADRLSSVTLPDGSTVTPTYDAGWRQKSACSSFLGCYAHDASYTALDQPLQMNVHANLVINWNYDSVMARLSSLLAGPNQNSAAMNRTYTYDLNGNVSSIGDHIIKETQTYTYDHRDRLDSWTRWGGTEYYSYDVLGNLTAKAGVPYSYPHLPASGPPHAPSTVNGVGYSYDANGNYLSGGAGSANWNTDNQPTNLTANGLTEQFTYDADGERLSRTHGGLTTYYIGDWLEYDVQGGAVVAYRFLFRFNGQVVATNTPTQWVFLLADHLGSTAVVADAANNVINTQDFDPWGAIRRGSAPQTSVNYTGQRRDDTGLLYYHSRYYNPAIAHFLSPDTLVPGSAAGSGGAAATLGQDPQAALRPLTVDFHEPGFTAGLNQENAFTQGKGFWFQLSNDDRGKAKQQWGPDNPQALNRYSYVLDNPLRYTDPTGHFRLVIEDHVTTLTLSTKNLKQIAAFINAGELTMGVIAATILAVIVLTGPPGWVAAGILATMIYYLAAELIKVDLQDLIDKNEGLEMTYYSPTDHGRRILPDGDNPAYDEDTVEDRTSPPSGYPSY